MSAANQSFECAAGVPIAGRAFRVPLDEGPVKVHLLFSSEPVNASSVAQQLLELKDLTDVTVMELRLPGHASLETLDFEPEADKAPAEGKVLTRDSDAGAPP